jgi:S-methylmethionine-dependent homocysteine/selenocysteine methylase
MRSSEIRDRLRGGELLLLDGATGSELQRRGVNLSHGSTQETLGAWSATANIEAPDIVRQVHEDYLRLGVDIVTSNNFWTSKPDLESAGLGDRWEEYARAAGQIAVAARDSINPRAYVAAGIAPPRPLSGMADGRSQEVQTVYREQARLLSEVGVDLILPEYVGRIEDCVAAVDASAEAGLPVFLGICHITKDGELPAGGNLDDLGRALKGHPVDAVLLMCAPPEDISASLPILRAAFDGPIGAYAHAGYEHNPNFGSAPDEQWHLIDDAELEKYTPTVYAEFAHDWIKSGAQIIGGCCGTRPEHIAALLPVVKGVAA